MVTCLQRPHLVRDAEHLADKVFEMRGQIDEKVRLSLALDRVWLPPCYHKPVVKRDIGLGKMGDKRPIDSYEAMPVVKIGKGKAV